MQRLTTAIISLALSTVAMAQDTTSATAEQSADDKYIESGLVSMAGKDGISWQSQAGDFVFKPYLLLQARGEMNYYDDEGLNLAEQDNILNSGFGVPSAIVGFAGRAFDKVTFNLAFNTAKSGPTLLNQAWFDINIKDELRFRVGKFKTPFNGGYLVRNGQTLFPILPASLTTRVNVPFSINANNPYMATGFDVGVQAHGLLGGKIDYRLGIFNGTGIGYNTPTNTTSDEYGIPSLLYAVRLAYMPLGKMPLHQGDPSELDSVKVMFAASSSYNVEANFESSNDTRFGAEIALQMRKLYFSAEAYTLLMTFVDWHQIEDDYNFWGAYGQLGYFVTEKFQPAVRFDAMDRNSQNKDGMLYMPGLGLNYYILGHNLKVQAMYQYLGKNGHEDLFAENDDDNGMTEHKAVVQVQFAF